MTKLQSVGADVFYVGFYICLSTQLFLEEGEEVA